MTISGGRSLDQTEVARAERLTRIEVEARHAREIAQDHQVQIGRIWERLHFHDTKIERNERSILGLHDQITWILRAGQVDRSRLKELFIDRDRRRVVFATIKYLGGGVILTLVATGRMTEVQGALVRGIFGLP